MATKKSVPKKLVAAKAAAKRAKKPAPISAAKKATAKSAAAAPKRNPITHHAKRLYHLTPKFIHGMVTGGFIGIVTVLTLNAVAPVSAVTLASNKDCDTNAVLRCGALDTDTLKKKYYASRKSSDANNGAVQIYDHFGITAGQIDAIGTTAKVGLVWRTGTISIDGIPVATKAKTTGRENIAGSTKVTHAGVTFYTRAPSVSFHKDVEALTAFVVMKNGVFQFAILGACGNPVSGTPVPKEEPQKPLPKPKPIPPTVVSTQTPPSTPTPPAPTVTVASQPAATPPLPQTGPGAVFIVALLAVIGGYVFHVTHRHVRNKRRTTHHA